MYLRVYLLKYPFRGQKTGLGVVPYALPPCFLETGALIELGRS